MKIVYTLAASGDLVEAYEYLITRGDIRAAQRLDASISDLVERLANREFDGPLTRMQSGAMVRSWRFHRFASSIRATRTSW